MRFQEEFAQFHIELKATLQDSAQSQEGYGSAQAADDALRVLENHMNALDTALVAIVKAIEKQW